MELRPKFRRWLMLFVATALAPALAYPAWRHLYPVLAAPGWDYRVFQDDIERVSALVSDAQGALFISQEFADGKGTILRRSADGSLKAVLNGLSKPDGLALYRDGVAVSQEGGRLPVLLLQGDQAEPLFSADNVEGVASDGHYLYAIEDKKLGRLLRYDPSNGEVVTLRDGLDEGEAITACADGRLFFTEKNKGWIKQWQATGGDKLVQANLNEPGFLLCSADGLWITEDATHMARVLLLDPAGQLQVILQHLRSTQTIIALEPGRYLLAEQGRNRILEIKRLPNGS
ncbi:strictosidine synthase family protein [Pseudomonas sp. 2FG]|uniref:strictosidine synthase family protein n=1 Tax=Pseudomonas sp. 2FG TaxID=2502191 RepID=UPI002113B00B|nr:strictosidine synthase family protein [Pseudomonas sp. 2FG]